MAQYLLKHETMDGDQFAAAMQDGATEEVYAAIRPDACLWCTPDWLWENNYFYSHDPATAGMGPFTTLETRAWLEKIGTKAHYIAKDGDQEISI